MQYTEISGGCKPDCTVFVYAVTSCMDYCSIVFVGAKRSVTIVVAERSWYSGATVSFSVAV